jgi:hypothetical protein
MLEHVKVGCLVRVALVSLKVTLAAEVKESINRNRWHLRKKTKTLMVFATIIAVLLSCVGFLSEENQKNPAEPQSTGNPETKPNETAQENNTAETPDSTAQDTFADGIANYTVKSTPTPRLQGTFESYQTMDNSAWWQVAANAWQYFSPGVGVDSITGLPFSGQSYPYFTDWDLGVYVQAVLDANAIGLIGPDDEWSSSARLEKAVAFLETRELNDAGYPYWFYQAVDGRQFANVSEQSSSAIDIIDTGRLFVALNNLRIFNSSLAPRINALVTGPGNRSDYAAILPSIANESLTSKSIYAYYVTSGFESFWPAELADATARIMNNIFSGDTVTTCGVSLPLSDISCDPLLCAVFETPYYSQLNTLARQVYLAHEAYYNFTSQYRAFSEGGAATTPWAYEWVVYRDGRTWAVLYGDGPDLHMSPVIYTKVAVGFLSIYNTGFAKNMTVYLEQHLPAPIFGYLEGVDEVGTQIINCGIHTNGLILGAAKYAMYNG